MKVLILLSFSLLPISAFSKSVKDFNSKLINDVQKDIQTDNDDQFKVKKKEVSRGPASVAPEAEAPVPKIHKQNQTGHSSW